MKKSFMAIILVFLLLLCSCTPTDPVLPGEDCIVTFVYGNGSADLCTKVTWGQRLSKPVDPIKENCVFDAWYKESGYVNEYDFDGIVTGNITLYARYTVDYPALTNKITMTVMKSNVTVVTKSYNTFLGIETESFTKTGSGIIFYENSSGTYFLLTNNHVTVKSDGYDKVSYTVEDYTGKSYVARLKAERADYDLAVLYFTKSADLHVIERAAANPSVGQELVAIGQPKGQSNAITYGTVSGYNSVTLDDASPLLSNVTFPVIAHNAPINNGSSGGAILDVTLRLIGINYAGASDDDGNFVCSYSVPIEKVEEFLRLYVWDK